MENIIYTVITGNTKKYSLKESVYKNTNWTQLCFTDSNKLSSKTWEIIKIPKDNNHVNLSRKIKIKYFEYIQHKYNHILYIDSKFRIKINLNTFIETFKEDDYLGLMNHPKRTCAYEESKFCIKNNIGNVDCIKKQINHYKLSNFPVNFGLFAGGIIYRKNTQLVIDAMKLWWDEFELGSNRDQFGLIYTIWKLNLKVKNLNWKTTYNAFI